MRGVVWFRKDLRIDDNPALTNALDSCEEVIGIYIFSELQWKAHNESNVKLEFLIENLTLLETSLSKLNIPLVTIKTESFDSLPKDLCSFVGSNKVEQIFWNNEFGANESKRDLLSCTILEKENVKTSRFDATSRTYKYFITKHKDPFKIDQSFFCKYELDLKLMKKAAKALLKFDDFESFSKSKSDVKTFICKVNYAQFVEEKETIIFEINANRFLRNMVRAIVGTLIEVGRKKISLKEFEEIILKKNRSSAGFSAPAKGLFLSDIIYDWDKIK